MNVYGEISQAIALLKLHGLFPFEAIRNQDERYETEDVVYFTFKWFGKNAVWGYILYTTVSIILYFLSRHESSNR